MRRIIETIIVAMLVTGCSAVQSFRTNGAANVELIDEENGPPEETDSDAGELSDEELELLLKEPTEGSNPQYASSPASELGEPTPDIGSPEYAHEYRWLAESVDNYEEVPGC